MPNQGPVKDPIFLIYIGGPRAQAIAGPVSGNGYPARNEEQSVERVDVDGLLATGLWQRPPECVQPAWPGDDEAPLIAEKELSPRKKRDGLAVKESE